MFFKSFFLNLLVILEMVEGDVVAKHHADDNADPL